MPENQSIFAASNSSGGFYSRFGDVFDPHKFKSMYIIHGGPGTGKSSLMRKIGEEAGKRELNVIYVLCASDPDSLDGIIIPALKTAVLDGTSPHTTEAKYPCVVETTIDLYKGLDANLLREKRREITDNIGLSEKYTGTAYGFLKVYGELLKAELNISGYAFLSEKAHSFAAKLVKKLKGSADDEIFESSFSGKGYATQGNIYGEDADIYTVTDDFGLGYLLLSCIAYEAEKQGIGCRKIMNPVVPSLYEALYFDKSRSYFRIGDKKTDGNKNVNTGRFILKKEIALHKNKLRMIKKCLRMVSCNASEYFRRVSDIHDITEKIYGSAMDFGVTDEAYRFICNEIFA